MLTHAIYANCRGGGCHWFTVAGWHDHPGPHTTNNHIELVDRDTATEQQPNTKYFQLIKGHSFNKIIAQGEIHGLIARVRTIRTQLTRRVLEHWLTHHRCCAKSGKVSRGRVAVKCKRFFISSTFHCETRAAFVLLDFFSCLVKVFAEPSMDPAALDRHPEWPKGKHCESLNDMFVTQ